jgi:hypothetical protein
MRSILDMKQKRGQIGAFQGAILSLVVIGILLGAAFLILAEFENEAKTDAGAATKASNATGNTSSAMEKIPNMLGLVILIIIIGVILGIVFSVIPTRTA